MRRKLLAVLRLKCHGILLDLQVRGLPGGGRDFRVRGGRCQCLLSRACCVDPGRERV